VVCPAGISLRRKGNVRTAIRIAALFVAITALNAISAAQNKPNHFTRTSPAVESYIIGGPWTLEQSGAAVGLKSAGYCDANGNQVPNPGAERMEPYYFPFITGHGRHLQGYFDYRPKDTDEAVVAASSDDAGKTWTFQDEVLQLRTTCPTQANKNPTGRKTRLAATTRWIAPSATSILTISTSTNLRPSPATR